MTESQSRRLFERYRRKGDLRALGRLFDAIAPRLLELARHLASSEASAEDLVQVTFLTAIERADRFDGKRSVEGWLFGILTNKAKAARVASARTPDPERLDERATPDPGLDLETAEFVAALSKAIEKVPESYRQVLRIHLADGKTPEAIAEELERPPGTVRVQLHRGLKHLRRSLPAGIAHRGLVVVPALRGLPSIRERVLEEAAVHATTAVAGVSAGTVLGGIVMGKPIVVATGTALVALGVFWAVDSRREEPADPTPVVQAPPVEDELEPAPVADEPPVEVEEERESLVAAPAEEPAPVDSTVGALDVEVVWSEGDPAPGIRLKLVPNGIPQPRMDVRYAETDEAGRATFEGLPPGTVMLTTLRGGMFNLVFPEIAGGERASARIEMRDGLDIEGVVVDRDEEPVEGATIWLGEESGGRELAVTDAEGSFHLRDLQPWLNLFASAPGKGMSGFAQTQEMAPSADGTRTVTLRLLGYDSSLAGHVRGPDGEPVAGASVRIDCQFSTQAVGFTQLLSVIATTDEEGSYRADGLHVGPTVVVVSAPGHPLDAREAYLEEGHTRVVDFDLPEGVTVTGVVLDEDGSPVHRAQVKQASGGLQRTIVGRDYTRYVHFANADLDRIHQMTDEEGRFRLEHIAPGEFTLGVIVADKSGGSPRQVRETFVGTPGAELTWEPRLETSLEIVGVVEDEDGRPLAGWRVWPASMIGTERSPWEQTTAADGSFTIKDCSDVPHWIRVYAPRHGAQWAAELRGVRPGDEARFVVGPDALPSAYLEGEVVDVDGNGIGAAKIVLRHDGRDQTSFHDAGEDGRFRVGPLPPGPYGATVQPPDGPRRVLEPIVLAPEEELDLGEVVIQAAGFIEVTVGEIELEQYDRVRLRLFGENHFYFQIPSEDGRTFRSEPLHPGTYRVSPRASGVAVYTREVEVYAGETTSIELALESGSLCMLEFRPEAENTSLDWIRVEIRDASGGLVLEETPHFDRSKPDDPVFRVFAGHAPGTYTYEATSSTGIAAEGAFEVLEGSGSERVRIPLTAD